jgi:colanic acid biosynthesis glycosyl transferase WcaI
VPSAFVFYQYFFPDDVVSSVHFSELCSGLAEREWDVTAFPCNRSCRGESKQYSEHETWGDVKIRRIWRPAWRQSSNAGRVLNAVWMLCRWAWLAMARKNHPDVVIIGTDPIFSVIIAPVWRFLKPNTRIIHWCFDLYPEAAYADGVLKRRSFFARTLERTLRRSYKACDLVVEIGDCMRERLLRYDSLMPTCTLVPWALSEPVAALPVPQGERQAVFGGTCLGLMYSGNFGRAHSYKDLLDLVRLMRDDGLEIAFSVRGNGERLLRDAVREDDCNIRFIPFAPAEKLEDRLAAADIHIVSLREEWTGTVVPSKFLGALAVGRPVLFCGSPHSAVARWIEKHRVGWVLAPGNAVEIANSLRAFAASPTDIVLMRERCNAVYWQHFSRSVTIDGWDRAARALLRLPRAAQQSYGRPVVVNGGTSTEEKVGTINCAR